MMVSTLGAEFPCLGCHSTYTRGERSLGSPSALTLGHSTDQSVCMGKGGYRFHKVNVPWDYTANGKGGPSLSQP